MNPKDPLLRVGPEHERTLLKVLADDCDGYPRETISNVLINLVVNAIRQQAETRVSAEAMIRDMFGKAANILLEKHYDSVGRKKGIFPYDQVLTVPLIDLRSKH